MITHFPVAYTAEEVAYIWTHPNKAVGYEGKLQLSQFDISQPSFRGLNFSRSNNSEFYFFLGGGGAWGKNGVAACTGLGFCCPS